MEHELVSYILSIYLTFVKLLIRQNGNLFHFFSFTLITYFFTATPIFLISILTLDVVQSSKSCIKYLIPCLE